MRPCKDARNGVRHLQNMKRMILRFGRLDCCSAPAPMAAFADVADPMSGDRQQIETLNEKQIDFIESHPPKRN